jgi:hypothetical protein
MKHIKYFAFLTILLLFFSMVGLQATATPPRYLKLQYQAQAQTLKVTIIHFSPAVKIHYVYRVEIDKNGAVYQTHLYKSQPRVFIFSYTYNVTANPGDTLTVSAYCVLWGFILKSETVTNSITIT